MSDDIVKPLTSNLSLEVKRAQKAAAAQEPELIGERGLQRNASKEFVIATATQIALGACQKTYERMGNQQAEALATVEAICLQHVEALRREVESRTLRGRLRRFWAYLREPWLRLDLDALEGFDRERTYANEEDFRRGRQWLKDHPEPPAAP